MSSAFLFTVITNLKVNVKKFGTESKRVDVLCVFTVSGLNTDCHNMRYILQEHCVYSEAYDSRDHFNKN